MFVGPKSPSYQQLTLAAKGLYAVMREGFGIGRSAAGDDSGRSKEATTPWARIDAMVYYPNRRGAALGWRIAKWAVAHADTFDVKYVIFNGRIWTRSRGLARVPAPIESVQLRPQPLRHDDHVHISVRH